MWDFKRFFKSESQPSSAIQYLGIPDKEFDEQLKTDIYELERLAEELGKALQDKFAEEFKEKTGKTLRVWLHRDIDGDGVEGLSSARSFEKEYRSLLVVDYAGAELDEDFDDIDIPLWYYFGGYRHGTGSIYNLAQGDLEMEIEEAIKELMNQF